MKQILWLSNPLCLTVPWNDVIPSIIILSSCQNSYLNGKSNFTLNCDPYVRMTVYRWLVRYSRAYFTRPLSYWLLSDLESWCSVIDPLSYSVLVFKTLILMRGSSLLRVVISTEDYPCQNINRLIESSLSHGASNCRRSRQIPHAQTTSLESWLCPGLLSSSLYLFFFRNNSKKSGSNF